VKHRKEENKKRVSNKIEVKTRRNL